MWVRAVQIADPCCPDTLLCLGCLPVTSPQERTLPSPAGGPEAWREPVPVTPVGLGQPPGPGLWHGHGPHWNSR